MRGAWWPVLLMVVGLVFLAHNLGFLPFGEMKRVLAVWWPVLLIVLGAVGLFARR